MYLLFFNLMGNNFDIAHFLKESGISMTGLDGIVPKSLEEIKRNLKQKGLTILEVHGPGLESIKPAEGYRGFFLHFFTREGTILAGLDRYSGSLNEPAKPSHQSNFGSLPPKPDSYKDGFRAAFIQNRQPFVLAPAVAASANSYSGDLPSKPAAYKD